MYIMSYFLDSDQAMRIAAGENLLRFEDINGGKPVLDLSPVGKIIRDPYVLRDETGIYRLFFTDNWYSNTLGYSTSKDLYHWDEPQYLKVMGENEDVCNCWAPELYYDREREAWMLFWSTSFYSLNTDKRISNRIWYCHTRDFRTYTPAKKLFDPGYQVIDASIRRFDGWYYMAFKDERGHNSDPRYAAIRTARSRDITGPYTDISPLLTRYRTEGPLLIEEDGWMYLFYDSFGDSSYRGMRTRDFIKWEDVSSRMHFPKDCKHLCILKGDLPH